MAFSLANLRGAFNAHFAEAVVYRPASGKPRTIRAVVNRNPRSPIDEPPGSRPVSHIEIEIDNDQLTGIASDQIDTGADTIDVAMREGGEVSTRVIAAIIAQDAGRMRLEVR